jgi:hypothetical protein
VNNNLNRTKEIREYLDQIVNAERSDDWWITERFVKNTLHILPKELTVISLPPVLEKDNFNCFIFALGLHTDQEFVQKVKGKLFSDFFHKLIDNNIVIETEKPKHGDIIAYQNKSLYGKDFTHVGLVVTKNIILSKWAWGPLLLHKKLHVPLDWGSDISYFSLNKNIYIVETYKALQ